MKRTKSQKAITLVALIITIIVLLILAVVAIRAVTGDGIIAHAKNARDQYAEKSAEENALLSNLTDYITGQLGGNGEGNDPVTPGGDTTPTIASSYLNTVLSTTANTKLVDKYGNPITVPAGFKILVDSTTGYTAADINVTQGIVIEDGVGNQFVWIPVGKIYTDMDKTGANAKTVTLGRYSWIGSTGTLEQPKTETGKTATDEVVISSDYTEKQSTSTTGNAKARNINDFYNSSIQNGGYYLGRYEAGDSSASTARTGTSGTSTPGTLVCKSNQEVYNWITQPDASAKSQAMYTDGFSSGTFSSDLVNSYAWDTAIIFIQTFGTEEEASSYASKNKCTSFAKTGINPDKYCNIYDLSGNAYELTTETSSDSDGPCTFRGGFYNFYNDSPTACTNYRYVLSRDHSDSMYAFRPLIYVAINS